MSRKQLKCLKSIKINFSKCLPKCEGVEIISYDSIQENYNLQRFLNSKYGKTFGNPKLLTHLLELAEEYNLYKDDIDFPTKYKSKISILISFKTCTVSEFKYRPTLHYIKVYFNTPKFDRITKETSAKVSPVFNNYLILLHRMSQFCSS